MEVVSAQEVCEYTYKVELIEVNKISLVVFNTTTGIKYQRYIEEYSELWEDLKLNFQHNFSLCFKMLTKALLDKDQGFNVSILHNIDYVVLQLSYINDLLGFTIDISVNQYKKDNLQESVNVLDYKQKLLEDENKSLKIEIKHIHEEVTELKRIINLLGDGFSQDNNMAGYDGTITDFNKKGNIYSKKTDVYTCTGHFPNPQQADLRINPFLTMDVINRLGYKIFNYLIDTYMLDYNIDKLGYDWNILNNMLTIIGKNHIVKYCINYSITQSSKMYKYDFTWKSFKELFDITI